MGGSTLVSSGGSLFPVVDSTNNLMWENFPPPTTRAARWVLNGDIFTGLSGTGTFTSTLSKTVTLPSDAKLLNFYLGNAVNGTRDGFVPLEVTLIASTGNQTIFSLSGQSGTLNQFHNTDISAFSGQTVTIQFHHRLWYEIDRGDPEDPADDKISFGYPHGIIDFIHVVPEHLVG